MPFLASFQGETVTPEEVSKDDRVHCVECGEELGIRERHERNDSFVARHFWHPSSGAGGGGGGDDDIDGCTGGESDVHQRMKAIALSKLKHRFPCREAGIERKIGEHIADVYAIFEGGNAPYHLLGKGVVVEAQYRHESKDIEAVTRNYLTEGFSVFWVAPSDMSGKDIELGNEINHWWGRYYKKDVYPVFRTIHHLSRFGDTNPEEVHLQPLDETDMARVNYSDVERELNIDIDTVIEICYALARHDIISISRDGKLTPEIEDDVVRQDEVGRSRLRKVMAKLMDDDSREVTAVVDAPVEPHVRSKWHELTCQACDYRGVQETPNMAPMYVEGTVFHCLRCGRFHILREDGPFEAEPDDYSMIRSTS